MKQTANIVTSVMDAISHLPGVATLDWCDRAAAALTRLHPNSAAAVTVGQIDARGIISLHEASGAARATAEGAATTEGAELDQVRESFQQGLWMGWSLGALAPWHTNVTNIQTLGLPIKRSGNPLSRRWEYLDPPHVLFGAVGLPGSIQDRILLAEIAIPDAGLHDTQRQEAALGAILVPLAKRLITAIGNEPGDRHTWLTPREEQVLWQLLSGKKVPQIAAALNRSVYTVHDHVKSLHRKLGASNRGHLVARALGHLSPNTEGAASH